MRADGYHDLRSLVMPISLADEVLVKRASADAFILRNELICGGFDCPAASNLALRAVKLMRRITGCEEPVELTLVKRIPLGAGLGGGSADAAATLRALNELWCSGVSLEDLAVAGAELGSDVPALVVGGTVEMEGRGEKVRKFSAGTIFNLVLAFPRVFSSTKEVYSNVLPQLTNRGEIVDNICLALASGSPALLASALHNDLEAVATALHPEIAQTRSALIEAGALGASMTGSGSCVFGVVRDAQHAEEVAGKLKAGGIIAEIAHTCPVM